MADNVRGGSNDTGLPLLAARGFTYGGVANVKGPVVGLLLFTGPDGGKTGVDVNADNPLPVTSDQLSDLLALLGGSGAPAQVTKAASYTTQQTGISIWAPASGKRCAVKWLLISTGGTIAGKVTLWFGASGDTAYSPGTDQPVAIVNFVPSATAAPGLFMPFPDPVKGLVDYRLRLTTDHDVTVDITAYGFEES